MTAANDNTRSLADMVIPHTTEIAALVTSIIWLGLAILAPHTFWIIVGSLMLLGCLVATVMSFGRK